MKKIFTLIVALVATVSMMAQNTGATTFVGNSEMTVLTADVKNASDTVRFKMNSTTTGDIILPKMIYTSSMTIPSFTIHNATFSMDESGTVATFANQTFSETVTVNGSSKKINGTSLTGTYNMSNGKFSIVAKFKYGVMPFEASYTFDGEYVDEKSYNGSVSVLVGGSFGPYTNSALTYNVKTYYDNGTKKMDVQIPTYELKATVMGDLTLGTYTVTGLTYDAEKDGYYKDYANDGLTMHFYVPNTFDADYAMKTAGCENILVKIDEYGVCTITNNFQPGAMPFPITSTFVNELNLDETKATASISGMTYDNVNVVRSMTPGVWNTLVLPFSMSAEQLSANSITSVKALASVDCNDNEYTLNFQDAEAIEAGKPYFVQVADDYAGNIAVQNATVNTSNASQTVDGVTLVGTYSSIDEIPTTEDNFVISDNNFYLVNSTIAMKGFRAYISTPKAAAANAKSFKLNFDGISTSIAASSVAGNSAATSKVISNGRLLIVKNGVKYNAAGARIK